MCSLNCGFKTGDLEQMGAIPNNNFFTGKQSEIRVTSDLCEGVHIYAWSISLSHYACLFSFHLFWFIKWDKDGFRFCARVPIEGNIY